VRQKDGIVGLILPVTSLKRMINFKTLSQVAQQQIINKVIIKTI